TPQTVSCVYWARPASRSVAALDQGLGSRSRVDRTMTTSSENNVASLQHVSVLGSDTEIATLFERRLAALRPDLSDNPYIIEALRVLPVAGYRSAIGAIWNAVVDDLRNKIIHRSLALF